MGRLVEGRWVDQWYDTKSTGGAFKREDAGFRDRIEAGGLRRRAVATICMYRWRARGRTAR